MQKDNRCKLDLFNVFNIHQFIDYTLTFTFQVLLLDIIR